MPWTRKQVKYLLSDVSPLSGDQKTKMKGELHANPAMGHKQKGSSAMKKHNIREMRIEVHRDKGGKVTGHTVHHSHMPKSSGKSHAFMDDGHSSYPFGPDGSGHDGMSLHEHVAHHLNMEAPASAGEEAQGEEAE